MASSFSVVIGHAGVSIPALEGKNVQINRIYNEHRHRVYSLAFWMTDHELAAEQVAVNTFVRAFASSSWPGAEQIDQALLEEIREVMPVEGLSLRCDAAQSATLHGNVKRVHLERAVVELPSTERLIFLFHDVEGYEHGRIARLLGISQEESKFGLHQARLRILDLVAQMRAAQWSASHPS